MIHDHAIFTVRKAERGIDRTSSRYLIFTADETFEDTDSIALIKFNTSDIHGHTNEGKTHKVKVTKARVPSLLEYKNIIDLQE